MAFSNIHKHSLGGGWSILAADFTATQGAADQTLAVAGTIYFGVVSPSSSAEPVDYRGDLFDTSVSGAITTVTIRTEAGISAGKYFAVVKN